MQSPELTVLFVNLVILAIAYGFIYPKRCGNDINKMVLNDLLASCVSLGIGGILFQGRDIVFNAVLFSSNWFWFCLFTYAAMEVPLFICYVSKRGLWKELTGRE
ncbi:MAG: hypothetical protein ACK5HY_16485 [Parahaliea sp.]